MDCPFPADFTVMVSRLNASRLACYTQAVVFACFFKLKVKILSHKQYNMALNICSQCIQAMLCYYVILFMFVINF